ncbi:MAG TPA: D-aminoacyl-tRNA deacylase, partial [Bacilli bacterium]|nr:D-aminoacyl-tRNA deacylase [Bacilli bacterium]
GKLISAIESGYLLLVGFKKGDHFDVLPKMVKKIANLRIFEDENGKMNLSLHEVKGSILSISQFTLYANLSKGNRPSFTESMEPNQARIMYHQFNELLKQEGFPILEGLFGAHMDLSFTNSGPVTIIIEF